MKTTSQIFQQHNAKLISGLIDNELPEAYCSVDPKDEVFNQPLTAPVSVLNNLEV